MRQPISDLLDDVLHGFGGLARATARVEWELDPRQPGRTAYRITGATREVVQNAIDTQMRRDPCQRRGGIAQHVFVPDHQNRDVALL